MLHISYTAVMPHIAVHGDDAAMICSNSRATSTVYSKRGWDMWRILWPLVTCGPMQ